MKYMRFKFIAYFGVIIFMLACGDITKKKSILEIEDNNRHYYPVLTGELLDVSFNLINKGENPLLITDVITSCGCIEVNQGDKVFSIPPGKERILTMKYNSAKNIGYVKHYITLYGNFNDAEFKELIFDVNVVPDAAYTKDYEELFLEQRKSGIENLVDGKNLKGYYLD